MDYMQGYTHDQVGCCCCLCGTLFLGCAGLWSPASSIMFRCLQLQLLQIFITDAPYCVLYASGKEYSTQHRKTVVLSRR